MLKPGDDPASLDSRPHPFPWTDSGKMVTDMGIQITMWNLLHERLNEYQGERGKKMDLLAHDNNIIIIATIIIVKMNDS